ncbi:hypothetical protein Tco_1308792, partial [Tanacetum coccineum]
CIGKLTLAAAAYFVWQERNFRLFKHSKRSVQEVVDCIMSSVRLKLLSCRFKKSKDAVLFSPVVTFDVATPVTKSKFRTLINDEQVANADVVLPVATLSATQLSYANSLVGYFVGKNVAFPLVQNYVTNTWDYDRTVIGSRLDSDTVVDVCWGSLGFPDPSPTSV